SAATPTRGTEPGSRPAARHEYSFRRVSAADAGRARPGRPPGVREPWPSSHHRAVSPSWAHASDGRADRQAMANGPVLLFGALRPDVKGVDPPPHTQTHHPLPTSNSAAGWSRNARSP